MKTGRWVWRFALVLVLLYALLPVSVSAETTGSCGEGVSWTLEEGVLTISGSGAMTDYASASESPWYSQRESIASVVIETGVTAIGDRAFYNATALTDVTIGADVQIIGTYTFRGCTALKSVTIPASVTQVEGSAFRACTALTEVTFGGNAPSLDSFVFADGASSITVQYYEGSTGYDGAPWTDYAQKALHVGTWITDSEADCATDGSRHIQCSYCQTTVTEPIPALGHNYVDGYCSVCQELGILGSGNCGSDVRWQLDATGKLTISGTGGMTSYRYDSSVPWASLRDQVKTAVIETGVTSIGAYAFYNCNNLTDVTIPDSVTGIGSDAFSGCTSLTGVILGDSITIIGSKAFFNCSSLTSVTIGAGVTNSGSSAFSGCSSLKDVYITDPSAWCKINFGNYFSSPLYNEAKLHILDENDNEITEVVLDDSVTTIPTYAFKGSCLTGITIPDSVTSIGEYVFSGCTSLTSVTIPDSVTSVGHYAFSNCTGLTGVTIPNSVTSIGRYAFLSCTGLTSVTIPDSITKINHGAFYGCSSLTSVTIPDCVTSIDDYAFKDCSRLISVTIPDSVTSIGESAFEACSGLTSITILDSAASIGSSAFEGCINLTSVMIPDSVTSIGWDVFRNCTSLTSVTIGSGVTSIGGDAFYGCSGLTSVTIGDSVASIGNNAFYGCNNLRDVYITDPSAWCKINFGDTYSSPLRNADTVHILDENGNEVTEVVLDDSVTTIPDRAFMGSNLTSITISDNVTNIGYYAFENCTGLTSVTIGSGVTSIGWYAFSGCTGLTSVTIPNSVTSIGSNAFHDCTGLTSVTIPGSVTSIGQWTFSGCTSLTSVMILDGVAGIDKCVFYGCTGLTSVTIPDSVAIIDGRAFYNCANLGHVLYTGTQEQWNAISIGSENTRLTDAIRHYNATGNEIDENGICSICEPCVYGHTYDQSVVREEYLVSAATCTSSAVYHISCVCGEEGTETFTSGSPLGHDRQQHEGKEPTCEDIGWNDYEDCSRCDYTTYEELPVGDHEYGQWRIKEKPTCKKTGLAVIDCVHCGYVNESVTLGKTDHTYKSVVTEPTASSQGYTTHTCTACGDSYVDSYTDPVEAEALIGGVAYASIADALETATSGQTVTLTANADATGKTLFIKSGVTLDLGAYTLKADGLIGLSGSTITGATKEDAASGAKLFVDQEDIILSEIAADGTSGWKVIPVWNGDHYVFARAMIYNPKFSKNTAADSAKVEFIPTFNSFVKQNLFNDGCDDNDVSIIITVVYMEGDIKVTREYFYTTPMVVASMLQSRSMFAEMTGCNQLTDLQFQISIVTEAGPVVSSSVYTY